MRRHQRLCANEIYRVFGAGNPTVEVTTVITNAAKTTGVSYIYCSDPNFNVLYTATPTDIVGMPSGAYYAGLNDPANYSCVAPGTPGSHDFYRVNDVIDAQGVHGAGAIVVSDTTHQLLNEALSFLPIIGTPAEPPRPLPQGTSDNNTAHYSIYTGDLSGTPGEVQVLPTGNASYVITAGPGYSVSLIPGATDVFDKRSYDIEPQGESTPYAFCVIYNAGSNSTERGVCNFQGSPVDGDQHNSDIQSLKNAEDYGNNPVSIPKDVTYDISGSTGQYPTDPNNLFASTNPLAILADINHVKLDYVHVTGTYVDVNGNPISADQYHHTVSIQEAGYYGAVFGIPPTWGEGGSDCMDIAPPNINVNVSPEAVQLLIFEELLAGQLIPDPTPEPTYDPSIPYYDPVTYLDPGTYLGPSGGGCP